MPEEPKNPPKKLVIDEDWKSQVEAEKESARHAAEAGQSGGARPSADAGGRLPPANFTFLVSTLYLQGAISLGLLPNPATNKADVQLNAAKHSIDLLTMLQEKTEGNRTPEESGELEAALHELRLAYVTVREQRGTNQAGCASA
jgi:hypothetical protein